MKKTYAWIKLMLSWLYYSFTPGLPVDLRVRASKSGETFWVSFFIALCFTLLGTSVASWYVGRLVGTDKTIIYFSQDYWNLVLYALICPAYVACCACIIRFALSSWARVTQLSSELEEPESLRNHPLRSWLFLCCCVSIGFLLTMKYTNDALHLKNGGRLYWFMERSEAGSNSLNIAGCYYVMLNFSLLLITMFGVMSYVSLGNEVTRFARLALDTERYSFSIKRERLSGFALAFPYAKGVAALYVANMLIWEYSPLGGTSFNVSVAMIALYALGGYLLIIPFDYLELKWNDWVQGKRAFLESCIATQDQEVNQALQLLVAGTLTKEEYAAQVREVEKQKSALAAELGLLNLESEPPSLTPAQRTFNDWVNVVLPVSTIVSIANVVAWLSSQIGRH